MGKHAINSFGQSHGDDINLMAPGKFISYDTLIQSMDDGTDLGEGVRESYWVDVNECEADQNNQFYSYSLEDFEEYHIDEPGDNLSCDEEEEDIDPAPYFMISNTLEIGVDETSTISSQLGISGLGRIMTANLSHEEQRHKDKHGSHIDRTRVKRRKCNKRPTIRRMHIS
jgi:hypothetical protein